MSPDLIELASTESTGGSTTGDDEAAGGDGGGGRDAACGGADSTLSQETRAPSTLLETRRNTQVSRGLVNPNQGGVRGSGYKRIDFPAPSLRMCGESIEVTVQYKDGATS